MRLKKYINESGFDKYPEGWNRDSVIKFANTLSKETGKGPTEHGFFDACVLKMEKHFGEGAKGFCASVKDEAYGHTKWRGKDKPKKEIPKAKPSKSLKESLLHEGMVKKWVEDIILKTCKKYNMGMDQTGEIHDLVFDSLLDKVNVPSNYKECFNDIVKQINKKLKKKITLSESLNEDIGNTILKQIKSINRLALPSWGAKNFVTLKDGVQFDVRGSKHKGKVIIKLKNDLYDIEAGTVRKLEWKSKLKKTGIYVENLVQTLDAIIG